MGSFTGIPIARRIGHKITSSVIMVFYAFSVFTASRSNNFILFAITMGFIPGLCVGNEYLIPVDNAVGYYPEKKGLIYGLILCGLGFSLLVFNPILQYFINPNGISPNEDGYYPIEVVDNF
jgi:OFA family oxalate/formate antiporter-like MFS transporter